MDWTALLAQAPIVGAFIWFSIEMQKRYTASLEKRDDLFQKSLQEQATQWRSFFTQLNDGNKDDVCKIADTLEAVAGIVRTLDAKLDRHDSRVDERIQATVQIATKPLPRKRGE
jgi:hypothetical protein